MTRFLDAYDAAPDTGKFKTLFGALRREPDAVFAELRAVRPILVVPGGVPGVVPGPKTFVLVTRMRDVQEVLDHWTVFTVRHYARAMDPSVGPFMLGRDDTEINQRDKSIMLTVLSRADAPRIRATCAELSRDALARVRARGSFDVVEHVSRRVPLAFCGAFYGFPGPDLATLARWSRAMQHDMFYNLFEDAAIHAACVQAGTEMRRYLKRVILDRRKQLARRPRSV